MAERIRTLHEMTERGEWLSIGCTFCGRPPKVVSAYEAAYKYGHALTIPEVRAVVKARCSSEKCGLHLGLALEHQIPTVPKGRVP
jgi:hypothetical protein